MNRYLIIKKLFINKKGFTLLELLAMLIILTALTAIAVSIFLNKNEHSKQMVHNQNIKILKKQGNMYMLEHITENGTDITVDLVSSGLLKKIPENPLPKGEKDSKPYKVIIDENGKIKINVNPVGVDTLFVCNPPKLVEGMVPVKFDGTKWIEVDENAQDNFDNEWYNYQGDIDKFEVMKDNERWANIQLQDKDKSMFVWIPRYAYKIIGNDTNTKNDDKIKIEYLRGSSNKVSKGYKVHSAFEGGLTGIWVAKFEVSKNSNNNIKVVPGVSSWRSITVNDIYNECISMDDEGNEYGLSTCSSIKTIMMRNKDWGAVAYLTEAIRDGQEVWINNSSEFITGSAGNSVGASSDVGIINEYMHEQCQKASTTGNIYGIYDMSGGAYEYVASYIDNGHQNLLINGESLIKATDNYKDKLVGEFDGSCVKAYGQTESQTKGMALHEISKNGENDNMNVKSFRGYSDWQYFAYDLSPFFIRGGHYHNDVNAGIFAFHNDSGTAYNNVSFRPIIICD